MVVVVMVVLEASNVGIKISKNDKCNAWLLIILFILFFWLFSLPEAWE